MCRCAAPSACRVRAGRLHASAVSMMLPAEMALEREQGQAGCQGCSTAHLQGLVPVEEGGGLHCRLRSLQGPARQGLHLCLLLQAGAHLSAGSPRAHAACAGGRQQSRCCQQARLVPRRDADLAAGASSWQQRRLLTMEQRACASAGAAAAGEQSGGERNRGPWETPAAPEHLMHCRWHRHQGVQPAPSALDEPRASRLQVGSSLPCTHAQAVPQSPPSACLSSVDLDTHGGCTAAMS